MAEPEQEPSGRAAAERSKLCVVCGKPRDPRYDPFCSKRCADVDLHRWLKGRYVIDGGEAPPKQGDDEA